EAPRQTVDEDGSHEALLNQEAIVAERLEDLLQPPRRTARADDPPELVLQGLRRQRGVPKRLQRQGLFQVRADLALEELARAGVLEPPGRSHLVGVVDALD